MAFRGDVERTGSRRVGVAAIEAPGASHAIGCAGHRRYHRPQKRPGSEEMGAIPSHTSRWRRTASPLGSRRRTCPPLLQPPARAPEYPTRTALRRWTFRAAATFDGGTQCFRTALARYTVRTPALAVTGVCSTIRMEPRWRSIWTE